MSSSLVVLDGAAGGGQILRNGFVFAALYKTGIRITNIRATRSPSGFRAQHLASVSMLLSWAKASEVVVSGNAVGSTTCDFLTTGKQRLAPPLSTLDAPLRVDIGTAGSVTLLAQTAMPFLALSATLPASIVMTGGTDVPWSPVADGYAHVLFPLLKDLIGLDLRCSVLRRGVFPKGQGQLGISVHGRSAYPFPSFNLVDRGVPTGVFDVFIMTTSRAKPAAVVVAAKESEANLRAVFGAGNVTAVNINKDATACDALDAGGSILIVTHTTTGCRLAAQVIMERGFVDASRVKAAVQELHEDVMSGGCVDRHYQDQLVLWMAMCEGTSRLRVGLELSEHTQCAIATVHATTPARFEVTQDDSTTPPTSILSCVGAPPSFV
eukprot:PhM_4_TR4068/c0_g1_i1/m.39044/K01974/RTCA, rtcA; RNA 3'-terminal phosphate cyclase (ATP)